MPRIALFLYRISEILIRWSERHSLEETQRMQRESYSDDLEYSDSSAGTKYRTTN
jgi:hypothetical protein